MNDYGKVDRTSAAVADKLVFIRPRLVYNFPQASCLRLSMWAYGQHTLLFAVSRETNYNQLAATESLDYLLPMEIIGRLFQLSWATSTVTYD